MKKLLSFLLVLFLSFSINTTVLLKGDSNIVKADSEHSLYIEPESFSATNIDLVANGQTEYVIVIPENNTPAEKYSAEELKYFLEESTNCKFEIISDLGLSHDNTKKYLSVGQTSLLQQQTDIVIEFEVMGESGPTVIRKENCVYMCGAHNYGTLYSVYKFLEYQIKFKAYSTDCIYFEHYRNLKLLDFYYQYVPTIGKTNAHEADYGLASLKPLARMFMVGDAREGAQELFDGLYWDGYFCHTNAFFIDQAKYPELYKNNQICYTSERAIEIFSESMYNLFSGNPSMDRINLGVNDWPTSCDCENCLQATEQYKGGGVLIRFCNRVAENLENRFKEEGVTRKIELVPLVYYNYINPPVVKNSAGEYVVIDDSCIPRKGDVSVGIMYTPILSCYHHSYENPCETNETNRDDLLGWKAIYDGFFYMYSYGSTFPGKYTYFDNMQYLAEQFRFYYDNDIRFQFISEQGTGADLTVLEMLKCFVRARLGWNPLLNLNDVINDFCQHYYGPASDNMIEYFDLLTNQWQYAYTIKNSDCLMPLSGTQNPEYWPRQSLLSFETCLINGIAKIESSDYDDDIKEVYIDRVNRDLFIVRYNEYTKYLSYYNSKEKETLTKYINENIVKDGYDPINRTEK